MPRNENTIQFSLPKVVREALQAENKNGESISLTAKRKLIELYNQKSLYQQQIDSLSTMLRIQDQRLAKLEMHILSDQDID